VNSLMTASRELSKYKLDLVGVQRARWEGAGTEPTERGTGSLIRYQDQDLGGWITLGWILERWDGCRLDLSGSG
jgi:hypothetical protein